jgi:hypothetical protein
VRRRRSAALAALLGLLAFASGAAAQVSEYQLKAVFLLNFTRFVEWPAEAFDGAGGPLRLCVLGHDPFDGALEAAVAGEAAGGHPLEVRRVRDPDDAVGCQLLFLSGRSEPQWLDWLPDAGVGQRLTVGEGDEFLRRGGMFRFRLSGNRVRLEVNRRAVEGSRLRVSAKLMSLAESVEVGPP